MRFAPRTVLRRAAAALDGVIPGDVTAITSACLELAADYRSLPDSRLAIRYQQLRAAAEDPRLGGRARRALAAHTFAVTREASRRVLGMAHRRVQILGAAALATGRVAQMRTGEGKTITAALAAALHALPGAGVHVMTANDYLAERDADELAPVYRMLGLSVAAVPGSAGPQARRRAYACDITYGTVSEFGFDYLRDNLVTHPAQRVQGGHFAAVVDEADAVLIDDASTPLVIAGPAEPSTNAWPGRLAATVPTLQPITHYDGNLAERHVDYTDAGWEQLTHILGLGEEVWHDPGFLAAAQNALTGFLVYLRGRDYLVRDGEIVLIDPHTARAMPGRRLTEGMHQALEAKEDLPVVGEPPTYATISVQRYLARYAVLGGMSGTVVSEGAELHRVYRLPVVRIPTHRPVVRHDLPDLLYSSAAARARALTDQVAAAHRVGRPVLVGTLTIDDATDISGRLSRLGISHAVLTAQHDAAEAAIVAEAGLLGAVTVATEAGRGTDIRLGGDPRYRARARLHAAGLTATDPAWARQWRTTLDQERRAAAAEGDQVRARGGLLVVAAGRGTTRRADDQLAGRAGRQGDPGASQFLLAASDELLLDNAAEPLRHLIAALPPHTHHPLRGPRIDLLAERAQALATARQVTARRQMLRYDEIIGYQGDAVYRHRTEILDGDLADLLPGLGRAVATALVQRHGTAGLPGALSHLDTRPWPAAATAGRFGLTAVLADRIRDALAHHPLEELRARLLTIVDQAWAEQVGTLLTLQHVSLSAAWSRTDPVAEYRRLAVASYRHLRTDLQMALLRDVLRDVPHPTLPVRAPREATTSHAPHPTGP